MRLPELKISKFSGFQYVFDLINPITSYGKELKLNITFEKEEVLNDELNILDKYKQNYMYLKKDVQKLMLLLEEIKNISGSVKKLSNNINLDITDIYEIKHNIITYQNISNIVMNNRDLKQDYIFDDLTELIDVLDPKNERIRTFQLYDEYSESLKKYRKNLLELDTEIFNCSKEKVKELKEKRKSIIVNIQNEENRIISILTKKLISFIDVINSNTYNISLLDLRISKMYVINTFSLNRPVISKNKKLNIKCMYNQEVMDELKKNNLMYTKTSIELCNGSNLLIGSNMGGKTVNLKTIYLNCNLVMNGMFPFCDSLTMPFFDDIYFLYEDEQSTKSGLSTFGSEVVNISRITKNIESKTCLFLIDEVAKGTDPDTGVDIVNGLIDYCNTLNSICVLSSHYNVNYKKAKNTYKVVGLSNAKYNEVKSDIAQSKDSNISLHKYMDYNLTILDGCDYKDYGLKIFSILCENEKLKSYIISKENRRENDK